MVPWIILAIVVVLGELTRYQRHQRLTTKDNQ